MNTFTPTLFGTRSISLLNQYHFGHDDPLFYPQPFDNRVPHLALIRHPSNFTDVEGIYWLLPQPDHFKPVDSAQTGQGIGHIGLAFRQLLNGEFRGVQARRKAASSVAGQEGVSKDGKILSYVARMKYLLGRLELPATYEESVAAWRLAQRTLLEFDARLVWLVDVRMAYYTPQAKRPPIRNVIGALTDQLDVAENCLRSGIPCWLSRLLNAVDGVKVAKWYDDVAVEDLPTRKVDVSMSFANFSPPRPIIYTGQAGNLDRYRAMAEYMSQLAFPKRTIYGAEGSRPVLDPDVAVFTPAEASAARSGSASEAGPSRIVRPQARGVPPYAKPKPAKKQDRNKFTDVVSPLMPRPLRFWMEASEYAGRGFNPNTPVREGFSRGYIFPDPNLLAGHHDLTSRAAYFTTYLKLRQVLIYRLSCAENNDMPVSGWRKVLGMELHGSRTDTASSKARKDIQQSLGKCIEGMGVSLDLSNLKEAPVMWRDVILQPFQEPPVNVAKEILWEMFEISFRMEFMSLDSMVYEPKSAGFDAPMPDEGEGETGDFDDLDASDDTQRAINVITAIKHFNGRLVPESVEDGRRGFASQDMLERRKSLWGLYRVMRTWVKLPPMAQETLKAGAKLEPSTPLTLVELDKAEYQLALFYTQAYVYTFRRAPLLPHGL